MTKRSHPSNPLALAVLALLFERPMHPYEMGLILKQRHKEESIKLRYGSLYTVIDLLLKRHLIVAKESPRFEAALCLLPVLQPHEALALLRRRLELIERNVAMLARQIEEVRRQK